MTPIRAAAAAATRARRLPPAGGGGWTPPYTLPSSGQAVALGAANSAMSVNPVDLSDTDFNYSLFESFGGGCYVEDYSAGGGYVLCSCGGHAHPDFTSGVVFDFEVGAWVRIDNSQSTGNSQPGYTRSQIDLAEGELNGFTTVPAPAHPYSNFLPLSTARGGGTKGSVVRVIGQAMTQEPAGTFRSHRFDLATGVWTRYSTNKGDAVTNASYFLPECPTAYDPNTGRYYQCPSEIHNTQAIPYVDPTDQTWKSFGSWDWPSNRGGENRMAFFDPVRNIVIVQRGGALLVGLEIANPSLGWRDLNISGTLPGGENRWDYYPVDGLLLPRRQRQHDLQAAAAGQRALHERMDREHRHVDWSLAADRRESHRQRHAALHALLLRATDSVLRMDRRQHQRRLPLQAVTLVYARLNARVPLIELRGNERPRSSQPRRRVRDQGISRLGRRRVERRAAVDGLQ
jgi:hypothetical protein